MWPWKEKWNWSLYELGPSRSDMETLGTTFPLTVPLFSLNTVDNWTTCQICSIFLNLEDGRTLQPSYPTDSILISSKQTSLLSLKM